MYMCNRQRKILFLETKRKVQCALINSLRYFFVRFPEGGGLRWEDFQFSSIYPFEINLFYIFFLHFFNNCTYN